jgi:hypothetical protein
MIIKKYLKTFFLLVFIIALGACKKENEDLTTDIVGTYTSGVGSTATQIIVTKIDNTTVSVYISHDEFYPTIYTHASTKMNSKTTFTLNDVTEVNSGNRFEYKGTGSASNNNIVIQHTEKMFDNASGSLITDYSNTYIGSK